jgi:hypothetical protein
MTVSQTPNPKPQNPSQTVKHSAPSPPGSGTGRKTMPTPACGLLVPWEAGGAIVGLQQPCPPCLTGPPTCTSVRCEMPHGGEKWTERGEIRERERNPPGGGFAGCEPVAPLEIYFLLLLDMLPKRLQKHKAGSGRSWWPTPRPPGYVPRTWCA